MTSKRSRQAFEADLQQNESPFVFYGTPLPPVDGEVRDDGSFVPIWKQEVTDDRGRKRLHGAFTGGFSAGYYNTVGSKEGWTPSTFVSSRQNRMKDSKSSKQMRPEDFMDEEDLREAEESRQLDTSDTFSGFGTEHDEKRRDAFVDLFRPTGETIGVQLLKRMGWKDGQRIGQAPRLDSQRDGSKTPGNEPNEVVLKPKNDRKGLVLDDNSQGSKEDAGTGTESRLENRSTAKMKPQKSSSFGVGVLNDTGSDDEDPYAMGPHISYNRVIGGDKKAKKKVGAVSSTASPALKAKPVFLSKKLASVHGALRKCHDGRLPLDGFVLGVDLEGMASLSLQNEQYRPPDVPPEWKSSLISEPPEDSLSSPLGSKAGEATKPSAHDWKSRAALLGESQLPGKSVFDYLSPAARERLVQASGRADLPQAQGENPPQVLGKVQEQNMADLHSLVPRLDQDVALQALERGNTGWIPYNADESKRQRYRTYLEIRAGFRATSEGDELPPRAEGMNQEQWVQELQEFARAAQVFKPVTGEMATRFTSSVSNRPASTDPSSSTATESLLSKPKTKPEDPAEAAARMGMFGPMTRLVSNFYPTRLVCKRFNVSMPDHVNQPSQSDSSHLSPDSLVALRKGRFQSAGTFEEQAVPRTANAPEVNATDSNTNKPASGYPAQVDSLQTIDPERNEALEQERPNQDLFKAVFGGDDEDD